MAWHVVLAVLVLTAHSSLCDRGSNINKDPIRRNCINSDSLSACPPPRRGSVCPCVFNEGKNMARCCHVKLTLLKEELIECLRTNKTPLHDPSFTPAEIKAIFLSNCTADNDELHLDSLATWLPNIETISLLDANYNSVNSSNNPQLWDGLFTKLKCMNLSYNAIENSDGIAQVVNAVKTLQVLDIANNSLTYSPELNNRTKKLWLHIKGNPQLKCDGIREATQRNIDFLYMSETYCSTQSSFDWFNITGKINLLQIQARENVKKDCPSACTCTTDRMIYPDKGEAYYTAKVNCSSQQLTTLPDKLPYMTSTLIIDHNNITSLEPLISKNRNYEHVRYLYADDNSISSIQILEGSKFLDHFEVFSLRNNKLQSLTLHVLSNAFERNWNSLHILLGNNFFYCDCSTYHTLKAWLIKNKKHIPDHDEIFCKDTDYQRVLQLRDIDVCLAQDGWHEYTYYLIGVEVLLLLLLVSKVSYDYWVFKNAGYLPWPASKMPKLPCDCVLET